MLSFSNYMSEGNIAIRLKGFMENHGLSYSQFADACGIPRPSLSQILNGRNKKVSDIILSQIHDAYPNLSISWLLFGEGDMCTAPYADSDNMVDGYSSASLTDHSCDFPDVSHPLAGTESSELPLFRKNVGVQDKGSVKIKASQSLRKVVSITVFYDDNSYEVFSPAKK